MTENQVINPNNYGCQTGTPVSHNAGTPVNSKIEGEEKMEHSSAISKAALATAIPGTVIAIGDAVKTYLDNKTRSSAPLSGVDTLGSVAAIAGAVMPFIGGNVRKGCDEYVTDKEAGLMSENGELKAKIYTDHAVACAVEKLEGKIDFINEKFTKGYDALAARYGELKSFDELEAVKREAGDREIMTYVTSNYIPAEKYLSHEKINYNIPCPGLKENCGKDKGKDKGKSGALAELIESGLLTGTLTVGTTATTTPAA